MKTIVALLLIFLAAFSCKPTPENPFQTEGEPVFEVQQLFENGRFPNVVIAKNGTVLAVWGQKYVRVRRSEDGGKSWGPEIRIRDGVATGGTIVDENSGDILVFVEEEHPPGPVYMFRSSNHGLSWQEEDIIIHPDKRGNLPSMHMNERGLCLQRGKFAGRLIRPTRVYAGGNETRFWPQHYTNAMYSDDGGKTWYSSEPFPVYGTGEAAIEELSDGTLYYNSRRHMSTDGQSPRWRYTALSKDGGQTWEHAAISDVLPDGNQHSDYGLMAGLVRLSVEGEDILLFSNIDMPKTEGEEDYPFETRWAERKRGTLWGSFDGGKTWPVKRLVDEGSFAYSSLAAGREGTPTEGMIYLFYESDGGGKIARFNMPWLLEK